MKSNDQTSVANYKRWWFHNILHPNWHSKRRDIQTIILEKVEAQPLLIINADPGPGCKLELILSK